ncbi:hypothetical protein D3C72_2387380 [compost metagenome]
MATEFQKKGRRPLQSTPVQALDQAVLQEDRFSEAGRASSALLRISSASLNEVTSIAYSGSRKKAVARASTA